MTTHRAALAEGVWVNVDTYVAARHANGDAADRLQQAMLVHPDAPPRAGTLLQLYRNATAFDHHKRIYHGSSLCALFPEAGFPSPRVREFLDSDIPADRLARVERRERVCNGAGVCVEARR